jgi:hypothetical protein
MIALEHPNSAYLIISSNNLADMVTILYANDYDVVHIKGYYKEKFEDSVIAFCEKDTDNLRKDALFLLNQFNQECSIIKYLGESGAKKIFKDGSEKPLGIVMYNTDSENISYIHNGLSFSFLEKKIYWLPKKKEDFKKGMIVEYMNQDKWFEKTVNNPSEEYDKMYKLLLKYNKIRIPN